MLSDGSITRPTQRRAVDTEQDQGKSHPFQPPPSLLLTSEHHLTSHLSSYIFSFYSIFSLTNIHMQEMTSTDMVTFEHHIPAAVARELSAIKKKYGVTIQSEKCKVCLGGRGKEGKRTRRRARILTANI